MEAVTAKHAPGANRVGLVAGYGQFPGLFADAARKKGLAVHAVAFTGQAGEELAGHVDDLTWLYLGELSRIRDFFLDHGVKDVVFAGGIQKTQMFEDIRLDEEALAVLATLTDTRDDAVMRAFADFLESAGLSVRASTWLLPELLAPEGLWTKRAPDPEEQADMDFGFDLAKKVGELDIGQTLAVARGSVLAVEAMEGTDACIRRAGELAGENAKIVVVKVKKPVQDERFDLPAAGIATVESMIQAGATALVIEAGGSVIFDREAMAALADSHRISIVGRR